MPDLSSESSAAASPVGSSGPARSAGVVAAPSGQTPDPGGTTNRREAPSYEATADAIETALDVADMQVTIVHGGHPVGLYSLARCLDKVGLIDWSGVAPDGPRCSDCYAVTPAEWSCFECDVWPCTCPAVDAVPDGEPAEAHRPCGECVDNPDGVVDNLCARHRAEFEAWRAKKRARLAPAVSDGEPTNAAETPGEPR